MTKMRGTRLGGGKCRLTESNNNRGHARPRLLPKAMFTWGKLACIDYHGERYYSPPCVLRPENGHEQLANETSCCGTDSERPHSCRHLANNLCSRRMFPIYFTTSRCAGRVWATKNCPFSWGRGSEPHLMHGSVGPPKSTAQTASFHEYGTQHNRW